MKIFKTRDQARKVATGNEVVVKINGVFTIMTINKKMMKELLNDYEEAMMEVAKSKSNTVE